MVSRRIVLMYLIAGQLGEAGIENRLMYMGAGVGNRRERVG